MYHPLPSPRSSRKAFTLLELLTVIAITGILAILTISGLGAASASQLATGGNEVVDLINQARQNAISENAPTALVMVTNSGNSKWDYHLFGIYQLYSMGPGQGYAWKQASKWTSLPTGVIVDKNNNYNMPAPTPALPTTLAVNVQGTPITSGNMAYQVFLPSGALLTTAGPPFMSLVSGVMNGTSPTYLGKTTSGVPTNYYEITINVYTGIPKVDRP